MTVGQLKKIYWILIAILVIIIVTVITNSVSGIIQQNKYPYVAGKTSKKCYVNGNGHNNIKYHILFKTLEECEEYINNN